MLIKRLTDLKNPKIMSSVADVDVGFGTKGALFASEVPTEQIIIFKTYTSKDALFF